jgi:xanthine/CO dehydrogenase XdhC/CoxF family maturation factor
MSAETETPTFHQQLRELHALGEPFAIATVIAVRGSASAKPGSKALITQAGKNIWGWVGGGCAESFVAKNAVEAMQDGRTRIIQADLDDEIFGLGMPCGGIMDVFIDPQLPPETLVLRGPDAIADTAKHMATTLGFTANFETHTASVSAPPIRQALFAVAQALAETRQASFTSLRETKGVFAPNLNSAVAVHAFADIEEVLILGSSRITEDLARWATIAKWPVRVYSWSSSPDAYAPTVVLEPSQPGFANLKIKKNSAVIVASHHKGDPEFIAQALRERASYVGLIASQKRSRLVMASLTEQGFDDATLARVHAPAGLDLGCRTPAEIALSCLAELIQLGSKC